ncbi:MAG: 4Fe-4S dicluster domain-containing protein [Planctomycetes bacterium]|nr:4Fe-4S dicluster domain-containing protein [Planctomycetota bacterium]
MKSMVRIFVDGTPHEVEEGAPLLEALRSKGISVPTLRHHRSLEPNGACRLCVVEISHPDWNGWSDLVTSCLYPACEGLEVAPNSPKVKEARRTLLELYLARCPEAESLRALARSEGLDETTFPKKGGADKCINCGLCTRVCQDLGPRAISPLGRGTEKSVGPRPDKVGEDCTGCGACAYVCPTSEIEIDQSGRTTRIWNRDFEKPVCRIDPALCLGCSECAKVCPFDVPKITSTKTVAPGKSGPFTFGIDPGPCTGCGICAGSCPAGAIEQESNPTESLSGLDLESGDLKGKKVVFACSRSTLPQTT